ncbi:hypothetical protein [Serratia fonticola]|uniref:hypothetical protein n=1 Tax=Serratia fonticola TaxID=47917 RepID=UPI0027F561E5|nr:hypothetical protein [Serratia fonticola]MDQ7208730.1 hypothetical protein [Serratia fonticola]HBE9081178.1 hypothetical protein [Serratia fonticola]HBE9091082.1 hypothetical protein [Serratia fonticola]HBE9152015.1 hypothetical protein [Serratia fonticola]
MLNDDAYPYRFSITDFEKADRFDAWRSEHTYYDIAWQMREVDITSVQVAKFSMPLQVDPEEMRDEIAFLCAQNDYIKKLRALMQQKDALTRRKGQK